MSLKFNPQAGAQPTPKPRVNVPEGQSTEGKANPGKIPQFTPDPEHCVIDHVDDGVYDKISQGGNTLENLDELRYSQVAKRAFLYSEILGRPLSQRHRK